eukprot:scaffold36275_cov154-Isochrysis_galbana.AAC.10
MARRSRPAAPAAGSAIGERSDLDGVPEAGAGAMRLVLSDVLGGGGGIGECALQHSCLRLAVGRGERGRLAVLPHAAAQEGQRDGVCRVAGAERDAAACLATAVAVGALVEGVAVSIGRGHAGGTKAVGCARQQHQADTGHEAAHALVHLKSAERGRERDAPRRDGEGGAGGRVDALSGWQPLHHLSVVHVGDTDEDAGARAQDGGLLQTGAGHRLIAALEQQPLLRVHRRRLRRRDCEELVVEELGAVHKRTPAHTLGQRSVVGGRRRELPARDWHLGHAVAAGGGKVP